MIQYLKKPLRGAALLMVLLTAACKKSDPDAPAVHGALISKMLTPDEQFPGRFDTTYFMYNADNTLRQITGSGTYEVVTFYYSPGLIRRAAGPQGFSPIEVDSIVLGSGGLPAAAYHISVDHPYGYVSQYYAYNAAGELARTIVVHPNDPAYPPDTITHVWSGEDMVSQSSENGGYNFTYTYNTGKSCRAGDVLYLLRLTETGQTGYPNEHICTGMSDAVFTYTYDSDDRITSYTSTQDGRVNSVAYFQYAQ